MMQVIKKKPALKPLSGVFKKFSPTFFFKNNIFQPFNKPNLTLSIFVNYK